ncbi:hypothetical protein ABD75_21530 [Bacillus vallismortis]|nr:hypothetical protein [Bacillus vallismortis]QAV07976.1 hypothetical protein BV11031_04850 [Bacillus vallismortis]
MMTPARYGEEEEHHLLPPLDFDRLWHMYVDIMCRYQYFIEKLDSANSPLLSLIHFEELVCRVLGFINSSELLHL